ncbi:MAG TPA: FxLYD domain-containing protein, partial [Syntrophales bacterium]|nr:FxLYD domain-containing protein [Syntrophales bacterium]
MKKTIAIVLCLLLGLLAAPALAAGKLDVSQENFMVIDSYWTYGYAYARIDNVGDKPIMINAGILEIFDANGDAITSSDYLNPYAEFLQPGEYTYANIYAEITDVAAADVADYSLTITGKSDKDYATLRLPVTTDYIEGVEEWYSTYNYMYATVTNDTDQPIYDVTVVLVLLDADGNILYMIDASMYTDKAIMPGSSIQIKEFVNQDFIAWYQAQGLTPASVDAIAFVNVPQ